MLDSCEVLILGMGNKVSSYSDKIETKTKIFFSIRYTAASSNASDTQRQFTQNWSNICNNIWSWRRNTDFTFILLEYRNFMIICLLKNPKWLII
jgi:hypothetical protein